MCKVKTNELLNLGYFVKTSGDSALLIAHPDEVSRVKDKLESTRFLVAGMGDALSTYFEARATAASYSNVSAGLPCGVREGACGSAKRTVTALGLAKLCYETLLENGYRAKLASGQNIVTPALENIIETNIL